MNALIAFSYQDAPLRVETDADGEPLFHEAIKAGMRQAGYRR